MNLTLDDGGNRTKEIIGLTKNDCRRYNHPLEAQVLWMKFRNDSLWLQRYNGNLYFSLFTALWQLSIITLLFEIVIF